MAESLTIDFNHPGGATVLGVRELGLENVGCLIFGYQRPLTTNDFILSNIILRNPDNLFLQDMPDEVCLLKDDAGGEVKAPCKIQGNPFRPALLLSCLYLGYQVIVIIFVAT